MGRQNFLNCTRWRVGTGDKIRFWEEFWCGNVKLKDRFPRIFAIAQNKNMFVGEAYTFIEGKRVWDVQVTRNLNDWEVD